MATQTRDMDWLRRNTPSDAAVTFTDITSARSCLAIMGPRARDLLQPLTDADLSNEEFPFGTAQEIDLGYARVTALRITYVGELGWELYIPTEFTTYVYDLLVAAGGEYGLAHAGYHATNSLRLEKGFRHWGHDITDEDTPLEAGLSFAVAFDKPGGFIGREALLAQRAVGVARRLVQFKLDDPEPLLYHDERILRDGVLVGHTTSGMFGHTVGAAVGMGYVTADPEMARAEVIDARFELQVNGQRHSATAGYRPFYDPGSERTRR